MFELPPVFGRGLRDLWSFAPGTIYLNHGAFGAVPKSITAAQDSWRRRMETQPSLFFTRTLPDALPPAVEKLEDFLAAPRGTLALVENATAGINAVLRSLRWRRGDVIVLAEQAYPAVRNLVDWLAARHELDVRLARVPMPVTGPQAVVDAYLAVADRVRIAIVDHVFSPSGVVAPVAEISARLKAMGAQVLVDAAHAAGMLDIDVKSIGADWVVGDLHKWLFVPRGCAFLYASTGACRDLRPAAISGLAGPHFPESFAWTGTRDYTPFLCVPAALEFMRWLGPAAYRRWLKESAWQGACMLCDRWGVHPVAPEVCLAAMVAVPLPGAAMANDESARAWSERLWDRHRIAVPVGHAEGRLWVRISAQVYNDPSDFEALADAVSNP